MKIKKSAAVFLLLALFLPLAVSAETYSAYTSSILNMLGSLIQTYKNVLNLSGSSSNNTTTTASTTATVATAASSTLAADYTYVMGKTGSRYIRIAMSRPAWIAWREIEIYDVNGKKITPTGVTASCDWCVYPSTKPSTSPGPQGAIDSNAYTDWNAGETGDNCSYTEKHMRSDGIYGYGCPGTTIRNAWIQLDLGSVKYLSKIKMLHQGDSSSANITITSSLDGSYFATVGNLSGMFYDLTWTEYPTPVVVADPKISLTVDGASSITAQNGQAIKFSWSSSDVDYVVATTSSTGTYDTSSVSGSNAYCGSALYEKYHMNRIEPFSSYTVVPLKGSNLMYYIRDGCFFGRTHFINLVGFQRSTGKTAAATAAVTVADYPNLTGASILSVSLFDSSQNVHMQPESWAIKPGGSLNVSVKTNNYYNGTLPVADTSNASGFTATAGSKDGYFTPFTITIPSNAANGVYIVRFKAGDRSNMIDIGVKVEK